MFKMEGVDNLKILEKQSQKHFKFFMNTMTRINNVHLSIYGAT